MLKKPDVVFFPPHPKHMFQPALGLSAWKTCREKSAFLDGANYITSYLKRGLKVFAMGRKNVKNWDAERKSRGKQSVK